MILVTGMHRSGTSLVAMTMEALGVSFGDHAEFYASDRWNALGYFERKDVMDINNRMITGIPRTGSRAAASVGQIRYLLEPRLNSVVARGRALRAEIETVRDVIEDGAIKDPRLCLTWPAWADHVDVEASVVVIRHPFDVAASLRRRQKVPIERGLRFWRYHMRALRERMPPSSVVIDLDSLIVSPKPELQMLVDALALDVSVDEAAHRFREAYAPELATRTRPGVRPALREETAELWDWVVGLRPIPIAGRSE